MRWLNFGLLIVLVFIVGCGDEEKSEPLGDTSADTMSASDTMSTSSGADTADVSGDDVADVPGDDVADVPGDDVADVSPLVCEFAAPRVAGTAQSDALAQSPARCGQAPYQWLTDADSAAQLGDIIDFGNVDSLSSVFIEGVLGMGGSPLPEGPGHDVTVRQFSYLTQDRGQLVEATAFVAYPRAAESSGEPLVPLLMTHGTTGFSDGCSPSNNLAWRTLAAFFATHGYVVVAPDFIGLKGMGDPSGSLHPYLGGQATAIASLDAVRALGKLPINKRGNLCVAEEFVVFGPSQGGHAALWVERLAPYYAPELTLLGGVAGVPPMDALSHAERGLRDLVNATDFMVAMLGTLAQWYDLEDRLDEVFVPPLGAEILTALETECNPGDLLPGGLTLASEVFQPAMFDAATAGTLEDIPAFGCLFAENGLTSTSIERIPPSLSSQGMLVIVGEQDNLVLPEIQRTTFAELCASGGAMAYLECTGAGHVEAPAWSLQETLTFLQARIDREPLPVEACAVASAVTCSGTPAP